MTELRIMLGDILAYACVGILIIFVVWVFIAELFQD